MRLLLFTVALSLCSCSANYYLKRSHRLERKAIEMGAVVKADTVFIDREVIVPERKVDTVVRHVHFRDTITVVKNKVVTRVKVDTVDNTIYVNTDCPSDTTKIKTAVVIKKEIKTVDASVPWWIWLIMSLMGLLILVLAIKR